ncbi:MAG: OsmC family protein [Chloroflexaceae bacterium]|jgi:uncharacterized OsmC-like protein|nr:OsmC family protein [Chloroflexaceae bacterium]
MPNLPDYLAFKAECMATLRDKLSDPNTPPVALTATARVAGGSGVRPVQVRQFTVVTDSGPGLAGYDLGPTAPELLLTSLASCLAHTFLIVAASHGVSYDSLEVAVHGEIDFRGVLEVDPHVPTAPQNLRYEARISSSMAAEQLAFIKSEVERLCPVLQAITQPLAVEGAIVNAGR